METLISIILIIFFSLWANKDSSKTDLIIALDFIFLGYSIIALFLPGHSSLLAIALFLFHLLYMWNFKNSLHNAPIQVNTENPELPGKQNSIQTKSHLNRNFMSIFWAVILLPISFMIIILTTLKLYPPRCE
jgi:Ca2+/Na+ antiporter